MGCYGGDLIGTTSLFNGDLSDIRMSHSPAQPPFNSKNAKKIFLKSISTQYRIDSEGH